MRTKERARNQEHAEVHSRLDAYAEGALEDVEWLRVRTHVAECDSCRADLGRPKLWNRASPQRILPRDEADVARSEIAWVASGPGWAFLAGTACVAALVAFGVGFALGSGF